jgi:hypothetical protein
VCVSDDFPGAVEVLWRGVVGCCCVCKGSSCEAGGLHLHAEKVVPTAMFWPGAGLTIREETILVIAGVLSITVSLLVSCFQWRVKWAWTYQFRYRSRSFFASRWSVSGHYKS